MAKAKEKQGEKGPQQPQGERQGGGERQSPQALQTAGESGGERQRGVARRGQYAPQPWAGGSPFAFMRRFSEEMDRFFDDFGFSGGFLAPGFRRGLSRFGGIESSVWSPQVEVFERGGQLVVRADLPGLTKDDINIEVTDDALVIRGERKSEREENEESYYRSERSYGSFYRRIPLPEGVNAEDANATFRDGVLEVTMQAPQTEGFFRIPVDSLTAVPALADALRGRLPGGTVVVSPDAGRVRMATEFAHRFETSVVVLHKRRESGTETRVTHLVGDVRGRACLIVDDMISTGGTMAESIEALLDAGARPEITVAATHGLLLAGARENLDHEGVREVFVTDTVRAADEGWPRLRVVSVAPLIAGAIRQFIIDGSLSAL